MVLVKNFIFFANRNTLRDMQIQIKIHTVYTAPLKRVLTSIQYPSLSYSSRQRNEFPWSLTPVAPVAQRYHVTSDTLGHEFDPGKRDFSH